TSSNLNGLMIASIFFIFMDRILAVPTTVHLRSGAMPTHGRKSPAHALHRSFEKALSRQAMAMPATQSVPRSGKARDALSREAPHGLRASDHLVRNATGPLPQQDVTARS